METWQRWNSGQAELAQTLFLCNAIQFGDFKLRGGSQSPIYVNLRTQEQGGPLKPDIIELIGKELYQFFSKADDLIFFDCIAGVPNAGDPIAEAFQRAAWQGEGGGPWPNLIHLAKVGEGEERRISHIKSGEYQEDDVVLLIDDVVTTSRSKDEAIVVLEARKLIVRNVLVVVDRGQGGREALARRGYSLHSIFTLDEMLPFYRYCDCIPEEKYKEVMEYLRHS